MQKQSLTTYEELYGELKEYDRENAMFRVSEDAFTVRLDKRLEMNVYDNNGEVYLEITLDGRQMTHWHPNYQEAYEDLREYVENPVEMLEKLKREMESVKEKTRGCMAFYLLWLVFTFAILFVLTELEVVHLSRAWEAAACVGLPVLMAAAFTFGMAAFLKKKKRRNHNGA